MDAATVVGRKGRSPLVLVSAYDAVTARIVDLAGVDIVLVGDSLGPIALGYPSIMPMTIDVMVHHIRASSTAVQSALLVADMPFGTYGITPDDTARNAVRLVKEGHARAIKMAGGSHLAAHVAQLTALGIPVMGHIGVLSHEAWFGGRTEAVGSDQRAHQALLDDARALEQAGCFSLIAKGVVPAVTRDLCSSTSIPVISIGSGPADGVGANIADVLGLIPGRTSGYSVRQWDGATVLTEVLHTFAEGVRQGQIPTPGLCHEQPHRPID